MVAKRTGRGSALSVIGPPTELAFLHLNIRVAEGVSDSDSLGEWDARNATIHYDPSQTLPVLRETVLHEMLHCIMEHTGIDPEEHEQLIRSVSPLLLETLRRNPELVEWLVG